MKLNEKKESPFSSPLLVAFVSAVVILLIESDFFVYWSWVNIFDITNASTKILIGISLLVLSLGFIAMFIIERYSASALTRTLYIITAIWTGILIYLLLASIVYITIYLVFGQSFILGIILFLTAIVLSIYGFIHGKKIFVKKIQIELPNLPSVWKGRTAVWISDLHLGSVHGAKFCEKITQISNSLSPDIVFIGGDLYDGTHAPDPLAIAKPLEKLSAKLGKFFISGNHEEFSDPGLFLDAVRNLDMKILDDEMINIDGVQIIGVDYLKNHKKENFQKTLENIKIDDEKPSILLKHEPNDLEVGEGMGISFQVSGHTHNGQQWPFDLLVDFIYKGYGYGLKHIGSMKVYVSSGIGGWGPPFRVGSDCEIVYITFV